MGMRSVADAVAGEGENMRIFRLAVIVGGFGLALAGCTSTGEPGNADGRLIFHARMTVPSHWLVRLRCVPRARVHGVGPWRCRCSVAGRPRRCLGWPA